MAMAWNRRLLAADSGAGSCRYETRSISTTQTKTAEERFLGRELQPDNRVVDLSSGDTRGGSPAGNPPGFSLADAPSRPFHGRDTDTDRRCATFFENNSRFPQQAENQPADFVFTAARAVNVF